MTLRRCCLFCTVSILGCMSVRGDRGIAGRDAEPLQLYLFSATLGRFPAVIYGVKSNKKLEVVREVVPQVEDVSNVVAAEDVIFVIHSDALPSGVQIIHKDDPARADDVAFDSNGFSIPSVVTTTAEPVGMSTELLLPMMDITHLPLRCASRLCRAVDSVPASESNLMFGTTMLPRASMDLQGGRFHKWWFYLLPGGRQFGLRLLFWQGNCRRHVTPGHAWSE